MEINSALSALSALSQETRLLVYKLLVEYGTIGSTAGDLARELNVPPNTLSFHLAHLERANLIKSNRVGRNINYVINRQQMNDLIGFMNENCCSREDNIECLQSNIKC